MTISRRRRVGIGIELPGQLKQLLLHPQIGLNTNLMYHSDHLSEGQEDPGSQLAFLLEALLMVAPFIGSTISIIIASTIGSAIGCTIGSTIGSTIDSTIGMPLVAP